MYRFLTLVLILQLLPQLVRAQPSAQAAPGQDPVPVTVQGVLVGPEGEETLPYATIAVYERTDSTMVTNTLTEADGSFELVVPPGDYYAVLQYVGFSDKVLPDLEVTGERQIVDLGEITMAPDAQVLQEVEVRAERSQMELKLDRRVFNVGKDLTNAGNSAADILDRVPSVTVDPEGNVSLRGSQGVRILVNGKPSGLLSAGDTEALLRMQGDIIESVEVITNPSARYEAEGEAGIINIVLKKNREKGVNGSFGATVGWPQNFGGSYNLNYRQRNFNFFSNFGLDYRKAPGGGNSSQRFFDNGQLDEFFTTETDQLRGGVGGYLQLGTDWIVNEKNTLTGSLLYRTGKDDNEATVIYRDFNAMGALLDRTDRLTEETQNDHNLEAALNYKRTFDQPDRELTFIFQYNLDDDTELADYRQTSGDSPTPLIQRSSNTEDERNLLLQADYVHPLGDNSKLEGGLRAALRVVDNDFLVEEQGTGDEFAALPDFDDRLVYTEDIYAAYLIGAHEFGPFGLQAGLRTELSDITAALRKSDVTNDQDYLSFFPSASLSYKMTEEQQLQVSYSRRLSRPYFRRLLPFSNFNNPRNNNIGNPNLRPEFTNSFELGYLRYFTSGTLLSSVYYRRTTGVIERITLPGEDGTAIEYPVNLAERDAYGVELNFSYDLLPDWNVTFDVNGFRALVNGQFGETNFSADTYTWNGRINSKLNVSETVQVQAGFDYDAPRNTTQGRRLSSYRFDLAASVDVFAGKGTFTLAGRDLFNTDKRRSIIDLPDYQAESVFQWRRRQQVVLTFNYRLNQDKRMGK
jgi:outer membrane receptor protein involved in Fe transport